MSFPRVAAIGAALALAGVALLGTSGPASAAPSPKPSQSACPNPGGNYPPGQCGGPAKCDKARVSMGDSTPAPGQKTHVHGECFQPNSDVEVYNDSSRRSLGTFRTNADGVFDGDIIIPRDLSAGLHNLVVEGTATGGAATSASAPYVVNVDTVIDLPNTGGAGPGAGGNGNGGLGLPRTGAEIALTTLIGIGCIGLGAAAIASGRRRRLSVV